jgi:hypothetical protein
VKSGGQGRLPKSAKLQRSARAAVCSHSHWGHDRQKLDAEVLVVVVVVAIVIIAVVAIAVIVAMLVAPLPVPVLFLGL